MLSAERPSCGRVSKIYRHTAQQRLFKGTGVNDVRCGCGSIGVAYGTPTTCVGTNLVTCVPSPS